MPTDLTPALSLTVTANSAYSSGNVVGSKQTIALPNVPALIQNVTVSDRDAGNHAPLTVLFFESDPSASTITDKTAFVEAAADSPRFLGHVDIAATDYRDAGGVAHATVKPGAIIAVGSGAARNIYAVVITTGTPTWTATTGKLGIRLGLLRA
jgi:hypothetical protein